MAQRFALAPGCGADTAAVGGTEGVAGSAEPVGPELHAAIAWVLSHQGATAEADTVLRDALAHTAGRGDTCRMAGVVATVRRARVALARGHPTDAHRLLSAIPPPRMSGTTVDSRPLP